MNNPFIQLVLMHIREFFREPGIIFWAILFPVMMAWILGIAFTSKSDVVHKIALISDSKSTHVHLEEYLSSAKKVTKKDGIRYIQILTDSTFGNTTLEFMPVDKPKAMVLLKRGVITMIINEKADKLVYEFDPKSPEAQLIYKKLTEQINSIPVSKEHAEIKPLSEIGTRYIDFLVPGLLALGIMNSCLWGISYTLIELRVKKLLRRIVATPMKKSTFMFSHFTARFLLGFVEAIVLYLFTHFYFGISITGSVTALIGIYAAGHFAFAGISVFIAARTAKSQIGNAYINAVSMPMMFLSGIFFSYYNFPEIILPVIQNLPLTLLADSIRSVFIEGAGWRELFIPFSILTLTGIVFSAIGLKLYKWY